MHRAQAVLEMTYFEKNSSVTKNVCQHQRSNFHKNSKVENLNSLFVDTFSFTLHENLFMYLIVFVEF